VPLSLNLPAPRRSSTLLDGCSTLHGVPRRLLDAPRHSSTAVRRSTAFLDGSSTLLDNSSTAASLLDAP
jgi:hypothetical protein